MADPAVWGDVATWVTGFFTAGPLVLALYLLQRDRKREQARQAQAIVVFDEWSGAGPDGEGVVDIIDIWNLSDQPIFSLEARWWVTGPVGTRGTGSDEQRVLEPGGRTVTRAKQLKGETLLCLSVNFKDAGGTPWHFDLFGGGLMTSKDYGKHVRRTLSKSPRVGGNGAEP